MEKTLQLNFKNAEGGKKQLNVVNPKEGLTKQEADDAMAKIVAANVFTTTGGDIVEAVDAKIVCREVEELA